MISDLSAYSRTAVPRVRCEAQLPVVEKLRLEAARRLAQDDELDAIERELRRDLHGHLSWDTTRRYLQQSLPAPAVGWSLVAGRPCSTTAPADDALPRAGAGRQDADMVGTSGSSAAWVPGCRDLPGPSLGSEPRDIVSSQVAQAVPTMASCEVPVPAAAKQSVAGGEVQRQGWYVQSQDDWQLGRERCTLTIFHNDTEGLLRFELLKFSTASTLYVTCTRDQFIAICDEQRAHLLGSYRVSAAVHQLFREALASGVPPGHHESEGQILGH